MVSIKLTKPIEPTMGQRSAPAPARRCHCRHVSGDVLHDIDTLSILNIRRFIVFENLLLLRLHLFPSACSPMCSHHPDVEVRQILGLGLRVEGLGSRD